MNLARVVLVALIAGSVSAGAVAQWKWRDRNGVIQYSDMPPPTGTAAKDILDQPRASQNRAAPAGDAATSASAAAQAASAPRGVEPELESRRRQAEIDKVDKASKEAAAAKRADDERVALGRADNCRRARSSLRTLEDGVRVVRTNEQGEREVLDDKARANEMAQMRTVVASDCAAR